MNKIFSLALLSSLTVGVHAQVTTVQPTAPTATERADRAFLESIEQREAPSPIPSLPPIATAPTPATVAHSDAPQSKPTPRATARAKPKATVGRSRSHRDGPVYRGVLVLEPPALLSRFERELRPVVRRLEAGPRRFIKITTTTVTNRRSDDEFED